MQKLLGHFCRLKFRAEKGEIPIEGGMFRYFRVKSRRQRDHKSEPEKWKKIERDNTETADLIEFIFDAMLPLIR